MSETPTPNQHPKYWELTDLIFNCPGLVPALDPDAPKIKIKDATRMVLWSLGHHINGDTDDTWVLRETIAKETQKDIQTVDRAIKTLKAAGLISAIQRMSDTGRWSSNLWRIDRARLEALVGPLVNDEVLHLALAAVKADGEFHLRTTASRLQQTRSQLFHLAGDFRLTVTEKASEGDVITMIIKPERTMETDLVTVDAPATITTPVASAKTPNPVKKATVTASVATPAPDNNTTAAPSEDDIEAVSRALQSRGGFAGKLIARDFRQIAKHLVKEYGVQEARAAVRHLSDKKIAMAMRGNNPAGYLTDLLRKAHKEMVESRKGQPVTSVPPVASPPVASPTPAPKMSEDEVKARSFTRQMYRELNRNPATEDVLLAESHQVLAARAAGHSWDKLFQVGNYVLGDGRSRPMTNATGESWFDKLSSAPVPLWTFVHQFDRIADDWMAWCVEEWKCPAQDEETAA